MYLLVLVRLRAPSHRPASLPARSHTCDVVPAQLGACRACGCRGPKPSQLPPERLGPDSHNAGRRGRWKETGHELGVGPAGFWLTEQAKMVPMVLALVSD